MLLIAALPLAAALSTAPVDEGAAVAEGDAEPEQPATDGTVTPTGPQICEANEMTAVEIVLVQSA